MTQTSAAELTPDAARQALAHACRVAELDFDGAVLVRMGENAMFHLRETDLMVRIGRSTPASRKEVNVVRWLTEHGFPCVRLADRSVDQPISANGFPVTFWELVHQSDDPVTMTDFGVVLRHLHALPPPRFRLPLFDPLAKLDRRLDLLSGRINEDTDAFLRERERELDVDWAV